MNKKILIATDGSTYCNHALVYSANLFKDRPEVFFHLLNCTSQGSAALPETLDDQDSLFPGLDKKDARFITANSCINRARDRLFRMGIAPDRITMSILVTGNAARAIQTEAERLLVDCIVIARRGIGFIGEMLLGSISADLFRYCHQIPLWIIDGEVTMKNILLSVDGTCHSLMAADHLAHILAGRDDIQIFLYHCRRFFEPKGTYEREQLRLRWDEEWCKTYLMGDNPVYDGPFQLLREAGIPKHRLTVLPEATRVDRSNSIINQARRHQCGTIILGRPRAGISRGIWGRSTSRTIKYTQNMALWTIA